jgi:hypothetical protein
LRIGVAVEHHRAQAVDEVQRLGRQRDRVPAQRVGRDVDAVLGARLEQRMRERRVRAAAHRGLAAVEPGALVGVTRRREGGARQQLGIEPERRALRAVAALRQRARDGLAAEVVAEAAVQAFGWRGRARHRFHLC